MSSTQNLSLKQSLTPSEFLKRQGIHGHELFARIKENNLGKKQFFSRKNSIKSKAMNSKEGSNEKNTKRNPNIRLNGNKTKRVLLQSVLEEVQILQNQKDSILEEIEFLLKNFEFILELVEENITKELSKKLAEMVKEKNSLICEFRQKIKEIQEKDKQLKKFQKENQRIRLALQQKDQQLNQMRNENEALKKDKSAKSDLLKYSIRIPGSENLICSGSEEREFELTRSNTSQYERINSARNEFNFEGNLNPSNRMLRGRDEITDNIRSMDKIKEKISRLKRELQSYG